MMESNTVYLLICIDYTTLLHLTLASAGTLQPTSFSQGTLVAIALNDKQEETFMKLIAIVLTLLLPSVILGQVDSLKDILEYLPLQDGNCWQYKECSFDQYAGSDTGLISIEVVRDTVMPNGLRYKTIHEKFYPSFDSADVFERIDSLTGCVHMYNPNIHPATSDPIVDSLFAKKGDTVRCYWGGILAISEYDNPSACTSIAQGTVLGLPSIVKVMHADHQPYPDNAILYKLAKGLGVCFQDVGNGYFDDSLNLVYARINGVEYGTRITSVRNTRSSLPGSFVLFQNYPNPFNPSTTISYQLSVNEFVTLRIFDVLGREVAKLVNERQTAGNHSITFNANNLPNGVYFYRLRANTFVETKKLTVLK
jgi:Secretion system C-terminal sorting domain